MVTPCDVKDENGQYSCPYEETYCGYVSQMCRSMCGLGSDETSYPEEDFPDGEYLDPFEFEETDDDEDEEIPDPCDEAYAAAGYRPFVM